MELSDIYFMESFAMILCIFFNIPSGAIADRIGRKKVLIIARIILFLYIVLFALSTSAFEAWVANCLWAVGSSLQSGSDQAMFYNTLNSNKLKKYYYKLESKYSSYRFLIISVCSILTGYLASIDLRIPFFISIPFMIIPIISIIFYKEEKIINDGNGISKQVETMKNSITFAFRKSEILWIISFCALIAGASKLWFFTYNSYFKFVGIDVKYFGIIFALMNILAFLSSRYSYKIRESISEKRLVILMISFIGLPILFMGIFPIWQMVFLLGFQNVVRGSLSPFVSNYMNMHIVDENIRSTTLSVRSAFTDTITIFSLFWFGIMDVRIGMTNSLIILGVIVLMLGYFSLNRYNRLIPKTINL